MTPKEKFKRPKRPQTKSWGSEGLWILVYTLCIRKAYLGIVVQSNWWLLQRLGEGKLALGRFAATGTEFPPAPGAGAGAVANRLPTSWLLFDQMWSHVCVRRRETTRKVETDCKHRKNCECCPLSLLRHKTILQTCDNWDTDYNSWQSLLPDN